MDPWNQEGFFDDDIRTVKSHRDIPVRHIIRAHQVPIFMDCWRVDRQRFNRVQHRIQRLVGNIDLLGSLFG